MSQHALDPIFTVPPSPMALAALTALHATCRYPVAPDDAFAFCGAPVALRLDGVPSSFCRDCRRLVFRPTPRLTINGKAVS